MHKQALDYRFYFITNPQDSNNKSVNTLSMYFEMEISMN